MFKRVHSEKYDHYTAGQREYVRSMILATMEELQRVDVDYKLLRLHEYL